MKSSSLFYMPKIFLSLSLFEVRRGKRLAGAEGMVTELGSGYQLGSCHNSGSLAWDTKPRDCEPGSLGPGTAVLLVTSQSLGVSLSRKWVNPKVPSAWKLSHSHPSEGSALPAPTPHHLSHPV